MKITGKTGIFGGTFDPPHLGHIRAATDFIKSVGLTRLLVIPTYIPPHKQKSRDDDPELRLQMTSLAFSDIPEAQICDYEIKKQGVSYSYETIEHFGGVYEELFFLVGDDMLLTLDRWRHPEVIFSLCTVVGFAREDSEQKRNEMYDAATRYKRDYGAKILLPEHTVLSVSSTDVRRIIREGGEGDALLTRSVADFIKEHGMYR